MFDFEQRRYLTANESFQRMTGYSEDELRQLTPLDVTHEDDREETRRRMDSGSMGVVQRKRYRRKDDEVIWADVTAFEIPATENTPAFFGGIMVDMTDRKRAEEALQQAQADLARHNRVMTPEEMAASIAHEVNQPIAAVITNANAGLRWLGAPQPDLDEVREGLGRIAHAGTRAGEVIGRIRALVKKVPPRRNNLDINHAIREVIALTQTEMQRNGVSWQSQLANDLPVVSADRVQLQQVTINLIVNATEAMAGVTSGTPSWRAVVREASLRSYPAQTMQRRIRRSAGHWSGARSGATRPPVPIFLHDQAQRDWHGTGDQPLDRRGPWRPAVGRPE
jgi:PAS domain S-box-containing protein